MVTNRDECWPMVMNTDLIYLFFLIIMKKANNSSSGQHTGEKRSSRTFSLLNGMRHCLSFYMQNWYLPHFRFDRRYPVQFDETAVGRRKYNRGRPSHVASPSALRSSSSCKPSGSSPSAKPGAITSSGGWAMDGVWIIIHPSAMPTINMTGKFLCDHFCTNFMSFSLLHIDSKWGLTWFRTWTKSPW